ncbi:metallophosphoesterase [Novosphingobium sp. FKTRR1]|uniref:metallophosphoesterase family protein n=1 Tax=Novosphingobium sp. FKTRR1 TaxID=2879118 RepID=UPI001CF04FCD|nr:metallophosphoesterase [Novosphingobium sp. FKTRR1]
MTRLFHVSDPHFGMEDRRALAWFAEAVARERPSGIALTGDLTMRARASEYAAARAWIAALAAPTAIDVGNHDLPYFNLIERFTAPYRRFLGLEGAAERPVTLPGVALVSMPTTARAQWRLNWSKGHVAPRNLARALATIDALPSGTRAIVTCHHPLVEAGTRGKALTRGGAHALDELARRNVLAVLSGHVHDPFDLLHETANGPIRMIGAGTLSLRLRSTPPSYNVLTIDDDGLALDVRMLPEPT